MDMRQLHFRVILAVAEATEVQAVADMLITEKAV
jgi:hypothetical protein